MNTFGISHKSFQIIQDTFKQYPQIEQVILFGSRAKGNFKKRSDIDLVLKGHSCTAQMIQQLSGWLNEHTIIIFH